MTEEYRRVGKQVDTSKIHPEVRRQAIAMFCSRHRHKETFYYRHITTVAEAIAYIGEHGTPPGISRSVWAEMVERMSMWRE
jgi:hypothetical protein